MPAVLRFVTRFVELLVWLPAAAVRVFVDGLAFNPRLGPFRHVLTAALVYVLFAVTLVYAVAPLRGLVGGYYLSDKLTYDAERWLATAIYDSAGNFAGTFDPRLDSRRDVNYTDEAIEMGDYLANPDHKSIPVREVPPHYWSCLTYHEDRYIGTYLNPFGIDLYGVLKIPYSTLMRSAALGRPALGVGGSTLPMQFARVIYKTPPDVSEGGITKLKRKLAEWWLAPVIYRVLTRDGDDTALKQWAANHLWLAQRTGGQPLHGVEVTSRIVFGKEARDLSIAEQFVLASAVNKPIILMEGDERLNAVRLDRWRYITEVRARTCAEKLLADPEAQKQVLFELVNLASGPPDPKVRPKLEAALEKYAPQYAKRAGANPVIRANALMPAARFGLREEMKEIYGFGWRDYVRGVTSTLDAAENLAFRERIDTVLERVDGAVKEKIAAGFTLDPKRVDAETAMPNVIVVAANARGEIVRYYEAGETAAYFGSPVARHPGTGYYEAERDPRRIASTGKIIAAIAIANSGKDTPASLYLDTEAPERGLETCARGGTGRHGRRAIVAFACSLNSPLLNRAALAGQERVKAIIDRLGFNMPPRDASGEDTPPSTASVLGLVSGSPRRVHQMASVVLASLIRKGAGPVRQPTLVKAFDYKQRGAQSAAADAATTDIVPDKIIKRSAGPVLRALLEAPLCYETGGAPAGTLRAIAQWCPRRRGDLTLHFAKTGTQVTADPNATVDTWIAGGLQFTNGAAYSYLVLTGTGYEPWATGLHAAQVATPLLEVLLEDLKAHAKAAPMPALLPPPPRPAPVAAIGAVTTPAVETVAQAGKPGPRLAPTAAEETLKGLRQN